MATIKCTVVTPEDTALDEDVSFVVVPMPDGELGVAAGHSPMIGRLGYGELRLKASDGTESRYYVDGGFVQVADNAVSVLTGRFLKTDQIDVAAVKEQFDDALKRPIHTDDLLELRSRALDQAAAQLQVARRAQ
ncbi:MAG: ATP synthase F1 subunit epsilon [Planctomycetales bacterium]|nr:ATP synthase F1 subunit epsilon [Planctomycetales bacterium]